jgi:Family of unknown function (DUF6058)
LPTRPAGPPGSAICSSHATGAPPPPSPRYRRTPRREWDAYLSGEYGVCLKQVTPETIVRKAALMARIETLLAEPDVADVEWAGALRGAVDELDALERQFAAFDRVRFGRPSSRDRLITGTRARYPSVFERASARS